MRTFDYCHGTTYKVGQGDSLYSISRRYNVALDIVIKANPYVDIYNLQVGDEICIPVEGSANEMNYDNYMEAYPEAETDMFTMPQTENMNQPEILGDDTIPFTMPPRTDMPFRQFPDLNMPRTMHNDGMNNSRSSQSDVMVNLEAPVISYVVKDKDTIKKILEYFGITLEDLLKYNGLDAIALQPGNTLKVPKSADD